MGAFSLWHWLIALVFLGVPVLAVSAVLLFLQQRERAKKNK